MDGRILVTNLDKETFFHNFQPLWLNTKTWKTAQMIRILLKGRMLFFYIWHNHSTFIWKPPHNGEVRRVISCLNWVFTHNSVEISQFCRVKTEIMPQSLSGLSQLILRFLHHTTVLVLSAVMTCHTATQGCWRGFSEAGGMWMRQACVWRASRDAG